MANSFTLVCNDCGHSLPDNTFGYICPHCKGKQKPNSPPLGVFKTIYRYKAIREKYSNDILFKALKARQFVDLLPIDNADSLGPLKVGSTPLYTFSLESTKGNEIAFYLKDDSQNPTFSFKDRASQLVSAYAKEKGIDTIVAASTGNAGSSLAGICASQKQKAIIIVPKTAPAAKLLQIVMYGATPVLVDGNYDAAFELSLQATKHFGWFNRNTAYNPFTIEGKKTVAFEIYDQLKGNLPSRIFVSVGDGVIISGVYKGFEDLLELGVIDKMPVIVAVQSEKSDNLVRNVESESFEMTPATTIADSISVDYPRNYFMAKSYLRKYKGEWLSVTDEEIIKAASSLARNTGIFAEPAAAAAMAGMLKYSKGVDTNRMNPMLVLSTGSGLKDTKTPMQSITLPQPIKPNIEALSDFIVKNI
jgi:threonine synthase